MAYSALEKMRIINRDRYSIDSPDLTLLEKETSDKTLVGAVQSFLRDDCENLQFLDDEKHHNLEDLDGKSLEPGQIPLHMQYDIDRLCLEQALIRFLNSGDALDAFDVYFCFLEIFLGHGSKANGSRRMVEMLSEFESNASALLKSHRDHYSHSVYVFALGLGIFHQSPFIKNTYQDYYDLEEGIATAHHFLRYWGFTSLFHDIGYPFELVFEQVKSYFGNRSDVPYVSYANMQTFSPSKEDLKKLLNDQPSGTIDPAYVLAENLTEKLYREYNQAPLFIEYCTKNRKGNNVSSYCDYLADILHKKVCLPYEFRGFMDHALFSALILMNNFADILPMDSLNPTYADVLSAVLLHNSLYKYSITDINNTEFNSAHLFTAKTHPLAYLLMMCDELQCWNRMSYGQETRRNCYPYDCELTLNGDSISAKYLYDRDFLAGRENAGIYKTMHDSTKFMDDLAAIIDINGDSGLNVTISCDANQKTTPGRQYLSESSYIHLYNFAVVLNAQFDADKYLIEEEPEKMEEAFDRLSLEYKLSNIAQAKAFGRYLNEIRCFYTDRPVAYLRKTSFDPDELNTIGNMEHNRWENEKRSMGWKAGTEHKKFELDEQKRVRELTRTHGNLDVPFQLLSYEEQDKDQAPMNRMMRLIEKYDGLRVYKLP